MTELMQNTPPAGRPSRKVEGWLLPALATGLLHGAAALMLWHSWSPEAPATSPRTVMITQLVTLPSPAPEPPAPVPEPEPVAAAAPPPPPEPQVDQGAIARKRLEQQQQREREEQHRLAEQRREQQRQQEREEQARREQQARELAEQRAHEEQQRLAAAAEAHALAEAEAARRAAEAAAIAQYQPISKQPPSYPRRALDRGLEGDCMVSYTVTRDGRVTDPQVVEGACDDPLFERPSLAAAKSFRYQPRLVNGQPVDVPGIRNTFRYRIQ
ncbi:energy transducer TonB [Pseudomonas sp. MYb185]|nr:energy transducer TonB [Pseudomonas sp. MYb185]